MIALYYSFCGTGKPVPYGCYYPCMHCLSTLTVRYGLAHTTQLTLIVQLHFVLRYRQACTLRVYYFSAVQASLYPTGYGNWWLIQHSALCT